MDGPIWVGLGDWTPPPVWLGRRQIDDVNGCAIRLCWAKCLCLWYGPALQVFNVTRPADFALQQPGEIVLD